MEIITQNEKILYIGIDVIRTAHWAGSGKKVIDFCCFLKSTEIVMFKTGMTTSNFWRVVKLIKTCYKKSTDYF